jgi:hypothetical protein
VYSTQGIKEAQKKRHQRGVQRREEISERDRRMKEEAEMDNETCGVGAVKSPSACGI